MPTTADLSGKTVLVTGATSGIGVPTATALARMGARTVIVARDRAKGEATAAQIKRETGNDAVELLVADLSSLAEVRRLAAEFKAAHDRLHVLVNNAGAYNAGRSTTVDGYETTFAVDHLAYFLLTELLLDTLKASAPARVVNVSSAAHIGGHINFDDLQGARRYSGMRAYGQSKLANVLFTYELARRLAGSGVTANCLHPGVVRTNFGKSNGGFVGGAFAVFQAVGRPFFITPEKGAETTIHLAASPDVEGVTGAYFVKCRQHESNAESRDEAVAKRLWDVSEQLTRAGATAGAAS
jgi:NAD(P)-dependent dehydrogenase (short-subunit alcohol dehydrogenase family)